MSKDTEATAWQEGYNAADTGVRESKNPYRIGSNEHLSWNDGYLARNDDEDA